MDPAITHVPQSAWYMNPFFMASFGAVVALGFVLFAVAYFFFVKLKLGQKKTEDEDCKVCGLSSDAISKYVPCKEHASLSVRMGFVEKWQDTMNDDYKELRRRVDAIERGKNGSK